MACCRPASVTVTAMSDSRSLSEFGWPVCECGCAVHISADSLLHRTIMDRRIGRNQSSHSRMLAATTKARQTPSWRG